MKKSLLFAGTFFLCLSCFSQIDTTKVEQYCQLVAQARSLSKKVDIDVDYGEQRKFFGKDTRLRDDEGNIKKFNGVVDALNYMGQQGWQLVNAYPVTLGNSLVYHYVFKKEFLKKDMEQ